MAVYIHVSLTAEERVYLLIAQATLFICKHGRKDKVFFAFTVNEEMEGQLVHDSQQREHNTPIMLTEDINNIHIYMNCIYLF